MTQESARKSRAEQPLIFVYRHIPRVPRVLVVAISHLMPRCWAMEDVSDLLRLHGNEVCYVGNRVCHVV
jgi:hypothetical protein